MAKDPAFLFYSTLFYEGTRMMLPEERACYVDLMIYQHQNGPIPDDTKRVLMYCSGIDEATLEATLKAKFKLTTKGWVNEKLNEVISERAGYKNKQSMNGTIGQFWKKCKAILTKKEYEKLRKQLKINDKEEFYELIKDKEINEDTLEGLLEGLLKHRVKDTIKDIDTDTDIDTIKEKKGGVEEKKEIELPYDSEKFKHAWVGWKEYKHKEHQFRYKTNKSELAALSKLSNMSGSESEAIAILQEAIANGWKGFFPIRGLHGRDTTTDDWSEMDGGVDKKVAVTGLKKVVDQFVQRQNMVFSWDVAELESLEKIAARLKGLMKERGDPMTMDHLETVLMQMLMRMDKFYKQNFSLKLINSNLNKILNGAKDNKEAEWEAFMASIN